MGGNGGINSWTADSESYIFIEGFQHSGEKRTLSNELGPACLKELGCMTGGGKEAWGSACSRALLPPRPSCTWEEQPQLPPHALGDALQHQLPCFLCAVHADPLPIFSKVYLPGLLFQKLFGLKGIMKRHYIPKCLQDGKENSTTGQFIFPREWSSYVLHRTYKNDRLRFSRALP